MHSAAAHDYALAFAGSDGVRIEAVCADIVDFQLEQRFDLAMLLMDSASNLLDNDAVLHQLDCVAAHLADGGLYVLEMSLPRNSFAVGKSTSTQWTSEADGLQVDMS